MSRARVYLDTSFVLGTFDRRDQHHSAALCLHPRLVSAEVWTTESVLVEVGNALSMIDRSWAVAFIHRAYQTENFRVVSVTTSLMRTALDLYNSRPDKRWGMTDCLSFVVMGRERITDALTADRHFIQAGFRALMLEEP